jgi:hypothetical protein
MRAALFVDAENIGAVFWPRILQTTGRKLATASVFADFGNGRCKQWREIAESEGFDLIMQRGGSNATDIAIAIAAMELMHTGRFDTVYFATSDRDYTPLVERLCRAGLEVVVMGEAKSKPALRAACSRFVELKPPKRVQAAKAA